MERIGQSNPRSSSYRQNSGRYFIASILFEMSRLDGVETLSTRANENVHDIDHWAPLVNALANPWTRNNPDGLYVYPVIAVS